jgi:protein tyrosine phosphatase (PTP) superfamily phosphohydrolase (DUF442 family)
MLLRRFSLLIILFLPGAPAVADLADIPNYREYSAILSSSGQPSKEQLQDARAAGFERVIYLAFSDHHTSIDHEDRIVKDLGMEFVNIPIAMEAPTRNDFSLFAGVMQAEPGKKTLVHCQINLRASAFSFLYRVVYEGVALDEAKGDMNSVWVPNEIWKEFILDVLRENDIDADCDACGW